MKILFLGDVVGQKACEYLQQILPNLKMKHQIDVTIVNGENSAEGNGITPFSANMLLGAGADVITTGNHCFKRREMTQMYDESELIIRPANFGKNVPGKGVCFLDHGSYSVAVINLIGTAYMLPADNPFTCLDTLLENISTPNIIVDFHAETTSEKKAMGYYSAGRVSAVIGTHTHVQTADEEIIDNHTGYLTDAGMTGVEDSVLGVEKEIILERLVNYKPQMHKYAEGKITVNGVVLTVDKSSGKCEKIERLRLKGM